MKNKILTTLLAIAAALLQEMDLPCRRQLIDDVFSVGDELGVETPFAIGEGVEIKNKGEQTIISVIVQGGGYNKPQNAAYAEGTLTWQAPLRSAHTVAGYNVYFNGSLIASLKADVLNHQPSKVETRGEYGVSAVYSDGSESDHAVALVPVAASGKNQAVIFKQSGFTIPGVMTTRYENATIEFWIKPKSLSYWNQTGGPGWGAFMFHADGGGAFTAGWDTSNRTNTDNWSLSVGSWTHVAIVVERNKMSIYLNDITGYIKGIYTVEAYTQQSLLGSAELMLR